MRPIKGLFMLLIGMISFTAMATTTAKPEQKQKMEIIKEFKAQEVTPVIVVLEYPAVFVEAVFMPGANPTKKPIDEPTYLFAVLLDVGWQGTESKNKLIPYREKLLDNYNLHFKSYTQEPIKRIRSNC